MVTKKPVSQGQLPLKGHGFYKVRNPVGSLLTVVTIVVIVQGKISGRRRKAG